MARCLRFPEWHKEPEVLVALGKFNRKYARPPDSSDAKQDLIQRLQTIGSHLQEQGLLFQGVQCASISYGNLKISKGLDFDILVVLEGRDFTAVPTRDPQYNLIKPNLELQSPKVKFWMVKDGFVTTETIARKFQSYFARLAATHSDFNREHGVVFRRHGPTIQMDVDTSGLRYSVDLVPTFRIQDSLYVAKPGHSQPDTWLRSYLTEIKQELDGLDRDNGCREATGHSLHMLCQKEPGLKKLSLNHLQMALLHETREKSWYKSWQPREFALRFFGLVRRVVYYIEEGNFPHYFLPEANLVEPLSSDVKNRLMKLYNKKKAFLKAVAVDEKPKAPEVETELDYGNVERSISIVRGWKWFQYVQYEYVLKDKSIRLITGATLEEKSKHYCKPRELKRHKSSSVRRKSFDNVSRL